MIATRRSPSLMDHRRPAQLAGLYGRSVWLVLVVGVVLGFPADGWGQDRSRSVYGWRLATSVGMTDVSGRFAGPSTGLSAAVGLDFLGSKGWGVGVGADVGVHDPVGDRFLIHTARISPRYSSVGRGGGYYQYLGVDVIAGQYQADRSTAPDGGAVQALGLGFGPAVGVGGLIGNATAMEFSLAYSFVGFRDARTNGGTLSGTGAWAKVLRIRVGLWFG